MMIRYYKKDSVSVWFLSEQPSVSASWLTNKFLYYSASNASRVILASFLYVSGIRNDFVLKSILNDDKRYAAFISSAFPGISDELSTAFRKTFKGVTLSMMKSSSLFKWAKQCRETMETMESYALALLEEYEFRKAKPHRLAELVKAVIGEFQLSSKLKLAGLGEKAWPWKTVPRKWRLSKDFFSCMQSCYASKIKDPLIDYGASKRDIPEFIVEKFALSLN